MLLHTYIAKREHFIKIGTSDFEEEPCILFQRLGMETMILYQGFTLIA